jgi:hypothetical protein
MPVIKRAVDRKRRLFKWGRFEISIIVENAIARIPQRVIPINRFLAISL